MATTVTTKTSWFSRLGNSFKGILSGFVIFILAFPLLFWNEGRSIKQQKNLEEGSDIVVSIEDDQVLGDNEGKLVHLTGMLQTDDMLTDSFGISQNAIALRRSVEMYQWQENTSSETKENLGGSEETTTTYTYEKVWSKTAISSGSFYESGHTNPGAIPFESKEYRANNVALGAFELSESLIKKVNNYKKLPVTEELLGGSTDELETSPVKETIDTKETTKTEDTSDSYFPETTETSETATTEDTSDSYFPETTETSQTATTVAEKDYVISGGMMYFGSKNIQTPQIGDYRVSFEVVYPDTVSVIAKQDGSSFSSYKTDNGTIELLSVGTRSAEEMFDDALASNQLMTWILRLVGFLMIMGGLNMILKPLSTIADVVPFIGGIVGFATGLVSFMIALVLSFITIGIAWVFYRPLVGGILIAIGVGAFVLFKQMQAKKSPKVV